MLLFLSNNSLVSITENSMPNVIGFQDLSQRLGDLRVFFVGCEILHQK